VVVNNPLCKLISCWCFYLKWAYQVDSRTSSGRRKVGCPISSTQIDQMGSYHPVTTVCQQFSPIWEWLRIVSGRNWTQWPPLNGHPYGLGWGWSRAPRWSHYEPSPELKCVRRNAETTEASAYRKWLSYTSDKFTTILVQTRLVNKPVLQTRICQKQRPYGSLRDWIFHWCSIVPCWMEGQWHSRLPKLTHNSPKYLKWNMA